MSTDWRRTYKEVGTLSRRNGVTVKKLKHRQKKFIIVKRTLPCDSYNFGLAKAYNLLRTLQAVRSDRLVSIYGFNVDQEKAKTSSFKEMEVYIEYMDKDSFDALYKRMGPIPLDIVGEVALAVSEAMSCLFDDNGIVPRCIKPSNIMLNAQGNIKLCDYGMSTEVINSQPDSWVRTSYYTSPERIQSIELDPIKGDVWALGITLIELALGRFPYGRIQAPEADWMSEEENEDLETIASPTSVIAEDDMGSDSEVFHTPPSEPPPSPRASGAAKPESTIQPGATPSAIQPGEKRCPVQPGEKDPLVQPGEKSPSGPSWTKQGVTWDGQEGTMSIIELLQVIVYASAPRLPEGCFPHEMDVFVNSCLLKDPKVRMSTKELLAYLYPVYIQQIQCLDPSASVARPSRPRARAPIGNLLAWELYMVCSELAREDPRTHERPELRVDRFLRAILLYETNHRVSLDHGIVDSPPNPPRAPCVLRLSRKHLRLYKPRVWRNYVCCNGIAAGKCCYWTNGSYGWAVGYTSMNYHYWGGVYSENQCGVEAGGVEASAGTSKSVPAPTGGPATGSWRSRLGLVEGAKASPSCPTVIGYTYATSTYKIDVAEGQYENLIRLLDAGDYKTLNTLAYEA
ncbi:hypothetical protein NMY22_g6260 [Coprinellus aureogranulatus]|nr:hypothetical protein NMY22_g6260 [Coprinellus aureogranulatus]